MKKKSAIAGVTVYPWSWQSFPSERTACVSSRSITVTNKSNSLTYTVASSFICTSPLAVTTVVGLLETLYGFQFGRVQVFPAHHVHARAQLYNKVSFIRFYRWCGWQTPFTGRWEEGSFVRFFEVEDVRGQSPRVSAGASLLSFSLFLRSVLKFQCGQVKKTTKCLWPVVFGEKTSTKGKNGTLQCSTGPERHGYHDVKDDMVSAWAPQVGHIVDVRWVFCSKEKSKQRKTRRWRCVESVTVSVVSVSAQLVTLLNISAISAWPVIFSGWLKQTVFWCTNSKESASRIMFRPRHSCTLVFTPLTAPWTCLGNTLRKSLFRSCLIRNKVATLTVVNSAVQRGTNIRDSDDTGEGAAPEAQALCTRPLAHEQRVSLVNRTRRIGSKTFVPFRKNDENSGGSVSCNTQPPHCCHHPSSFFLFGCSSTFCAETITYCRIDNPIQTYRTDIWEDANGHKYLSRSLCTAVDSTSQTISGLWGSFSSTYFYLFVLVAQRVERFLVSVLHVVPETALRSSRTLSFFSPATRNHRPCLNFVISGVKFSKSKFSSFFFSSPSFSTSDNWSSISCDESPCHTILIRFWVDQTHVFSICTDFPEPHLMGYWSFDGRISSHLVSHSWTSSFRRVIEKKSA